MGCKVRSEERASPTDRRKTWEDTKGCTTDEGCASSVLASVPIPLGLAAVVATGVAGQRVVVLESDVAVSRVDECVRPPFLQLLPGFCKAEVKMVFL